MITEALAAFRRSYLAGFDKLYPEPALFALAARFQSAAHCGVNHDAKGKGHDGAPEDADRTGGGTWQFSGRPMYAAFAGNGKAVALPATRPRTDRITDRCADLLLAVEVAGVCNPTDIPRGETA
jgi:hypothetical protein